MIDLETLGVRPGSAILTIGAVRFNSTGLKDEFYARIDAKSCVDCGLQIDVSTVMWWLQQGDEARKALVQPGRLLKDVLQDFASWSAEPDTLWGNGASFDNSLLSEAYLLSGIPQPWKFWNDRCYRTLKGVFPEVPFQRTGTHHNALDDAKSQALHLIEILKANPNLSLGGF